MLGPDGPTGPCTGNRNQSMRRQQRSVHVPATKISPHVKNISDFRIFPHFPLNLTMFRNYLKVALRGFRHNKSFSSLNILGLSLGMACSLLILLWVKDERSVDAFHSNTDRLFILYERVFSPGKVDADYDLPAPLGAELKKTIPEVQYAVSTDWDDDFTFRGDAKTVKARGGYAGEDFFKMFSFPLLQGNPTTVLKGPANIAISKSLAIKLFGSPQAAMGKTLRRDRQETWKDFVVTAIFDDVPSNSSLRFEFLMSWKTYYEDRPGWERWDNSGPRTMVLLQAGANTDLVATKIRHLLESHGSDQTPGYHTELALLRFDDMYLHSGFKNGYSSGGRIEYVRLFSLVAIFILVIACINFMNLTTARSVRRAKEIGVRKVIGANKGSLIRQFLGEAVLLATGAMGISLLAVFLLLPVFNAMTDKNIVLPVSNALFWLQLTALTLITGCLSGSYPALYLSSFRPVAVLKGVLKTGMGAVLFRKGLVVFQFTLSIILIIGTIIVTRQVNYIQTLNLGFDRAGLVYIPIEGDLIGKYRSFSEQALRLPGIQRVTCMTDQPTFMDNGTSSIEWTGKSPDFKPSFTFAAVGYDFARTTGTQVLEGRDFSPAFPTDTTAFVLNEDAVKKMGFRNITEVIGQPMQLWDRKGKVIGVIKDFHFNSLHDPVKPLILYFNQRSTSGDILVRTKPGQTREAIASLQLLCRQLNPAFPFSYQFADTEYQKLYKSETIIGQLSNYFAFLAILISCLGLLGLAMFTAEQRTKEIGIRKVLGAGTGRLFALLARDFLLLVVLAFLIAAPVAAWAMSGWLGDYAYHTPLSGTVFVIAGLLAFLIALATISYHSIRTALANPVKSLKSE
jgi:putative ABC transport system permease protein